jgi:ribonucleoside-diphosphate reductase beta chain
MSSTNVALRALTISSDSVNNKLLLSKVDPRQQVPIHHPLIRNRFKIARNNFWVPTEINMNEDIAQVQKGKLDDHLFNIFKCNISYLTVGDNLVPDNIISTLMPRVVAPELRQLLRWIIAEEANHVESYTYILESFGFNDLDQQAIFELYKEHPSIKRKVEWNINYMSQVDEARHLEASDPAFYRPLIANLVSFYVFEYVFFPAGFSQIFGMARNGVLRNTAQQYSYILRDENLHSGNALFILRELLHNEFNERVFDADMKEMIRGLIDTGVTLELEHNKDILCEGMEGYSFTDYSLYVKWLANKACANLGVKELYPIGTHLPIPWITMFQLTTETNFFEARVREYKVGAKLTFKEA